MTDHRLIATPHNAIRPSAAGIYTMRVPHLMEFRFEYHPETKRVFYIRVGAVPEFGVIVAEQIGSVEEARHVVLYWGRGYLEGKAHQLGQDQLAR